MDRRAGIYARQSLDRTGEQLAVTRQIEDCLKVAERKGWQVVERYIDNDTSASSRKPRPEYERMISDVESGRINALVVWSLDRLHRRPIELERFIDVSERHRLALGNVGGDVDLSSSAGRLHIRIMGDVARHEVEHKGERQARANLQRAENGDVRWTRRPFGYDRVDGKIVKVATEVREIKKAAKRVLDGSTLAALVRDLNARAVPTSTGGRWSVSTLRRILLNPRYAGLAIYKKAHVGDGQWSQVLDIETHRRLVAVLTDPKRRLAPTNERKYLLSGLALCGKCGGPLYAAPVGRKPYWMAYRCFTNHLARRMDLVDGVVEGVIIERLSRPDAVDVLTPPRPDLLPLLAERDEIRQRLDDLAGLLAEGLLTAAGVRKQSVKLRERLEEIERARIGTTRTTRLTPLVGAANVDKAWHKMPLLAKREVIDLLLVVTILPAGKGKRFTADQVRVDWRRQ